MSQTLYAGPIIDCHIHLWDLSGGDYPWLGPDGELAGIPLEPLKRNYLLDDYRRDTAGQNVVAAVHIEALWNAADSPVNETRWLESLDKSDGIAVRYTTAVPFGTPETAALIAEQASYPRAKAVRQVIAHNPDGPSMIPTPELTRDPAWREAIPHLVEHGLALELLLYPWQSHEVVELATAFPELTIIVDHVASPVDQSAAGLAAWSADVARMATAPNVLIKLSSVGGYIPDVTPEKIAGVMQEVIAAFGADRAMVGSDFPVGGLMGWSYAEVFAAYRGALAGYSEAEQYALFCGTAARVFGIDPESPAA